MVAESYNRMSRDVPENHEDEPLMTRCQEACENAMQEYPLAVTLGAFAVGLGLGAAVGAALARPLGFQHEVAAEKFGRRVLASIAEMLPESVQRHMPL
jgi:hypothetical protein